MTIERLSIERNLRPRRRLPYDACEVKGCRSVAAAKVTYDGRVYLMCDRHTEEYRNYEKISGIEPLTLEPSTAVDSDSSVAHISDWF